MLLVPCKNKEAPFQLIAVASKRELEETRLTADYTVISISSPGDSPTKFPSFIKKEKILEVIFEDKDEGTGIFDDEQAKLIIDFIIRNKGGQLLVFQCQAGMCRSAALAAAYCRYFEVSDMSIYSCKTPNSHVRRTFGKILRDQLGETNDGKD